jgi:hypothetical protein
MLLRRSKCLRIDNNMTLAIHSPPRGLYLSRFIVRDVALYWLSCLAGVVIAVVQPLSYLRYTFAKGLYEPLFAFLYSLDSVRLCYCR